MNRRLALVAGFALILSPCAHAADEDIFDVRGYYGIPPDYDVTGSRNDIDGGHRIGVQHMRNFTDIGDVGGWIWGAEVALQFIDDRGVEAFIPGVTGFVGYAYKLENLQNLHFEGTPFLGLGIASFSGDGNEDSEMYVEYGLRVAGFWTFESGWQAGLDLRLIRSDADVIDNSGLMPCFVGGYRF